MKRATSLLAPLVLLAAVGCGQLSEGQRAKAIISPYEPPVAIPAVGIIFADPGEIQAAVTTDQAIMTAQELFPRLSDATAVYTAFGLFTDTHLGTVEEDEGPVTPRYSDVPAWILTFQGVGIPQLGGRPGDKLGPPSEEVNIVIDATTGKYMMGFSST